jgi:hypothetical protein
MTIHTLTAPTLADLKAQIAAYSDLILSVTIRKTAPRTYTATITVEDAE